jgi:cell division protein FtsB
MSAARADFQYAPPTGGIWHSLNRFLFTLIVLTVLTTIGFRMLPEVGKRKEQLARVEQLKAKVETEKQMLFRHLREENLLKRDQEYLNTIIRDRFNLMKPGETIYRLDDGTPDARAVR